MGRCASSQFGNSDHFGFCGEIGTMSTKQCTCRTTLHVTRKIKLCSLGTAIVTNNFSFHLGESISIKVV